MTDRISYDDFEGHAGCRHNLEGLVKDAIREFFTSAPAETFTLAAGASVANQLRAHLQVRVPTVTWNLQRVMKAIRAFIEDEAE